MQVLFSCSLCPSSVKKLGSFFIELPFTGSLVKPFKNSGFIGFMINFHSLVFVTEISLSALSFYTQQKQ